MTEKFTKADPYLKDDKELLKIVMDRMALPTKVTGITDLVVIEGAIGALFLGQRYGLRILRILHSARTLRQYEDFLGHSFEELIPQHGPFIDRSVAWFIVSGTKKYWDLVTRKFKMEGAERRRIREIDTAPDVR